jgi:hypothetical protein
LIRSTSRVIDFDFSTGIATLWYKDATLRVNTALVNKDAFAVGNIVIVTGVLEPAIPGVRTSNEIFVALSHVFMFRLTIPFHFSPLG